MIGIGESPLFSHPRFISYLPKPLQAEYPLPGNPSVTGGKKVHRDLQSSRVKVLGLIWRGLSLRRQSLFREEEGEEVLSVISCELIENLFEVMLYVDLPFFQGIQDTHEDAAGVGACI